MERFRAEVRLRGPNPFVDVPPRVSEAFAPYARAGRIKVTGRLEGVEFSATLVPVRTGGHLLHVPGGLRAGTGVRVGDTVTVELEPLHREEVRPPHDLAGALDSTAGAREGFEHLPATQRRELVRYLEDARTPTSRSHRLEQVVAQALGHEVRSPGRRRDRPLWTCPRCGRALVTANTFHSCAVHTLDDAFGGRPDGIRQLFDRIARTVETFGPVTLVPYRDRVAFMVRVRFAGVRPARRWVDVDFWLPHRVESPRVRKVETLSPYTHVHTVRVTDPSDLNAELVGWLRQAYDVGCRRHLRPGRPGDGG